jgi:hypothetical protein
MSENIRILGLQQAPGSIPFRTNIIKTTMSLVISTVVAIVHANAYTARGSTYTTNGSASDVQAACTAAPNGSTVVVPSGTFSWTSQVNVTKSLTIQGTIGATTIQANATGQGLLALNKTTAGSVTVSGIIFVAGATNPVSYISIYGGTNTANGPFIVHDCTFNMNGSFEAVDCETNGGIFFNCTFNNSDTAGNGFDSGGINLKNPQFTDPSWSTASTMGAADTTGLNNTYIENCTFNGLIFQALDFDDNSRTVVRYNTFNDSGLTSHGQDSSPSGNRHTEIYNNTWTFHTSGTDPNGNAYPLNQAYGVLFRGGTGVIYNNVMPAISSQQWGSKSSIEFGDFNIETVPNAVPCQTVYPSARQVGQTWIGSGGYAYSTPGTTAVNGTGYSTDPVYIWGNTGTGNYSTFNTVMQGSATVGTSCGNGEVVGTFIQSGRDVMIGTQKPGYTAYTYPHPLRTGGSVPTVPAAPQNLRVTN